MYKYQPKSKTYIHLLRYVQPRGCSALVTMTGAIRVSVFTHLFSGDSTILGDSKLG